jgi:hypothetical protein
LGLPLAVALLSTGCKGSDSGTLKLVTGGEDASATFAGVSKVNVTWYDQNDSPHALATVAWPTGTIDLGTIDESSVGMIEVTGSSASGEHLVFGSSIALPFGAFAGLTVPIFVQRVGAFSRLPMPLSDERPSPLLGILGGRYLVVAGGGDPSFATASQIYDLLALGPLTSPPTLPVAPQSMALAGTTAYLATAAGVTAFDFADSGAGPFALPAGNAADIAGGATVSALDGTQYIVGPTRTVGAPTAAILRIDTAGNASWITLASPRWGAAAVWVQNVGLVVIGGSASAPGAEVVDASATTSAPMQQFAADPAISVGAATLDGARYILLAGGSMPDLSDPGVRVLDLECDAGNGCAAASWGALPVPLVHAQAFGLPDKDAGAVVGSELGTGRTHVFVVTSTGATEIPTKVPHVSASAIASPIGITPGGFLLYGGAPEIESFAPPF